MGQNIVIGVDLAKASFQVHMASKTGRKLKSKRLTRDKFTEFLATSVKGQIFMEACGSSNFWARKASAFGHEVNLIAPQYVKPFVKRQKTDAADAEAIVEAGLRENMNFVPIKTTEQQDLQAIRRMRELEVTTRTAMMNQVRGLLAEYGVAIAQGHAALRKALAECINEESVTSKNSDLTPTMRLLASRAMKNISELDGRIAIFDRELENAAKNDDRCKRIMTIPGIGPITAGAIVSHIGDARDFKNSRQLAAYFGLTPKQHSTGGKVRLMGISKAGNKDIRTLLIHGGRAVMMNPGKKRDQRSKWAVELKERVGMNKAAVAMAHKNIRTVYALLRRGGEYKDNYTPRLCR
jgi:transposase